MNYSQFCLKSLRAIYQKVFGTNQPPPFHIISDIQTASDLIYQHLVLDKPCMVARFGAFEMATIINYIGVKRGQRPVTKYIKGEELDWWWNITLLNYIQSNAGFFPSTVEKIEKFCEMMIQDIPMVDILGSWLDDERYFQDELKNATLVEGLLLEPFWSNPPWTNALRGKKILVIHPFAQSIRMQYEKRKLLFKNKDILPEFELKTIKAVQSMGGANNDFADWFEALDYMKAETDKTDYDICLIGCGAYGFPLAAHVKRMGKKVVHLGGCLQLLFGIRGARWENPDYHPVFKYTALMNDHWVRPCEEEKPKNAEQVEGACYW